MGFYTFLSSALLISSAYSVDPDVYTPISIPRAPRIRINEAIHDATIYTRSSNLNMCRLLVHSIGCNTYYAFRYEKPFKYGRPRVPPRKADIEF